MLLGLCGVGLALLWLQRVPVAEHYVERALAERGVRATYTVSQIALRTQRIENLVLGDPARPDLVARSVEVEHRVWGDAEARQLH